MGTNPVQLVALAAAALCAFLGAFLLFRANPRAGVLCWVAALFFTPVWLGTSVSGIGVTALTAITVVAIISGLGRAITWSSVDTVMVVLSATLILSMAFGGAQPAHLQDLVIRWILPYVWGRLVLSVVDESWLAACIAVAASVAAILAIGEFITGDNIFLSIPGAESSVWGDQRERAGLLRVEGAFGHSIALGGSLSVAAAFIMVARFPAWVRALLLILVGTATVLTFSRLGIVGLVLTVILSMILLSRAVGRALTAIVAVMLAVGAVIGLPTLLQVFGDAGAEAEGSAEYRGDLLSLLDRMVFLGVSPAREVLPTGEDYWGGFRSIDSALILAGLQFGLIPLGLLVLLIGILIVGLVRSPTPAAVALAAQVPAFATVALITQYASFIWFIAGVAVASYGLRRTPQTVFGRQETAQLMSTTAVRAR